jgi:Zn-dependent peptidase ImmA (M78 family)
MPFRSCRPDEEAEATALGRTLLLPRPPLLSAARRNATVEQIAKQYGLSLEIAPYRYNTTGVATQARSQDSVLTHEATLAESTTALQP